jgi:hypothetical protein
VQLLVELDDEPASEHQIPRTWTKLWRRGSTAERSIEVKDLREPIAGQSGGLGWDEAPVRTPFGINSCSNAFARTRVLTTKEF